MGFAFLVVESASMRSKIKIVEADSSRSEVSVLLDLCERGLVQSDEENWMQTERCRDVWCSTYLGRLFSLTEKPG